MPASQLPVQISAQRASDNLLEALRRWRAADKAVAPGPTTVPGPRVIDANRPVVERAKGVLMMRYGIDSYQAFAVMVRWSRLTRTPVLTIAQTLLRGICEGNPQTEIRQHKLIRWLEDQLRHGGPVATRIPPAPFRPGAGA